MVVLMKIAISIWEDKVSPVFDTALKLLVIEFEDRKEISRLELHIGEEDLLWKCHKIQEVTVDVIICGAVSHLFLNMLKGIGINVIQHISGKTEEIIEAYLKDDIYNARFLMPGCKRDGYRCGGRKKIILQQKNKVNEEDSHNE
jgi:predicted Fe-Mo cluster-binding NifX family protein